MVVGAHLGTGNMLSASGEEWLAGLVAPHASNFVDVGANVGNWAFAFARRMTVEPEGLLFEPAPKTAAHLRARLAKAGLNKLEVIERAVSDHAGQGVFYVEPGLGETSSLHTAANRIPAAACRVMLTKLDEELSARKISQVSFLKIDAEGHDFHALGGCQNHIAEHRVSVIQFEHNQSWIQAGATLLGAFEFLQSHGYKVRLLHRGSLGELDVRRTRDSRSAAAPCGSVGQPIMDVSARHWAAV